MVSAVWTTGVIMRSSRLPFQTTGKRKNQWAFRTENV